ncbi:MAG TPA: hypothetical protein VFI95_08690 [Terriglobales bacterium]|nr:hypothetical protein [Terriglobales bacterium]
MEAPRNRRRWNVITSGLLVAALALIVTFTSSSAFFSSAAIVVVAAVGVMALLLQVRFYHSQTTAISASTWLNVAGVGLALIAFFGDRLGIRPAVREMMSLAAIGCFGVSGALVLHHLRKRRLQTK